MASFPLKIQYRGVIKRAQFTYDDLSSDKGQNMADMYNIIKSLFGIKKPNSNISLTFLDEENDSISFSSDRELDAAFALVKSEGWKSFKVNVDVDSDTQSSSSGEGLIGLNVDKGKKDKEKEKEKNIKKNVSPSPLDAVVSRDNTKLSVPDISKKVPKAKAKATFIANDNAPAFVPKNAVPECIKAEKSLKSTSTVTSVPLRTTSGGAYIYPDGTVEFGMGGEAFLLPDGKTVSCTLSYRGFPSVAAAGTVLTEGKWYYEVMILTDGLMQIGWADTQFEGNSNVGEGVGDDSHSIAYDGKRKLKWHNGRSQPFGDRWKAGDVVCCAANLDDGIVKFALNGKWSDRSTAFSSLIFHDGLMPAASFSKGEKLCFNFGSSSSGFVHGPPNEEYLPVYIAQGNANTMKKMKKVVEKQQERKKRMMKEVVGKTTAMPPPPPYAKCNAKNSTASGETDPTVQEQFIALLLKDEVRDAISRFLAKPQVALMIQHLIVGVLSGSTESIHAQIACMIPLLIQLGSEAPALLGLIPILTDPNFVQRFQDGNNTPGNLDGDKSTSSNAYSDTNFPPPQPGVWGGWHPRHRHPHHWYDGNRCPWKKCGGAGNSNANNSQHCWRKKHRCPWKRGGCKSKWVGDNQQQARNVDATQKSKTTGNSTTESPIASTFGKLMSNVLNATGGQAMKWVGEMCEQPINEKQFSSDLQKAITQSLKDTQPVYQQKPSAKSIAANSSTINKSTVSTNNNSSAKKIHSNTDAVRPRAKFVEQYAVAEALKNNVEHRVSLLTMLPGEKVSHTWKMVNPSEANAWPKGVCAKSVGGDDFVIQTKEWMPLSIVGPKATVNIVVDAIAPEKPGRYIHYWRLHDANNSPFGDRIWLDMTVVLKKQNEVVKEQAKKDVANTPLPVKAAMSLPSPPLLAEKEDKLNAALINKLLDDDLKILPEFENNEAVGVEEDKTDDSKDEIVKQSDGKEGDDGAPLSSNVVVVVQNGQLEDGNVNSDTAVLQGGKQVKPADVSTKDISDTVSTTSTSASSVSNPDEQWDLLHSSSFADDTVSSESMMRVQKYAKQLDLLSSMGFSNRDALITLLDQYNGDVQKVINSFVTSK